MLTIKKLITKEWVKAYIGSVFILFLLITVADIVNELLRDATTFGDIILHHILNIPKWFHFILPIASLTATLFSLNRLQMRNELIAILASGLSRQAFIFLLLKLSFIVGCIHFINSSYMRPYTDALKKTMLRDGGIHFRSDRTDGPQTQTSFGGKTWYRTDDYFCSFSAFDKYNDELKEISIFFYSDESYKTSKVIYADSAKFMADSKEWVLFNGRRYLYLKDLGFPMVEDFNEMEQGLKEKPRHFKGLDSDIKELDIRNLYSYVEKLKKLGINTNEYEMVLLEKFSFAFVCLIFGVIPVQAIFRPNRRQSSFGKNIFFILVFTIIFWLLYSSFVALGVGNKVPSFVATFTVPLACGIYILIYFYKNRHVS